MGHYLNIYGVPKNRPDEKILLFDVSAGNEDWDLYALFQDSCINPPYPAEYRDGEIVESQKYSEVTLEGLCEIREELEKTIKDVAHRNEVLYKLGVNKPEETAFEIISNDEYVEQLVRQKHGIEFLMYMVQCCGNSYNGLTKLICCAD